MLKYPVLNPVHPQKRPVVVDATDDTDPPLQSHKSLISCKS